MLLTSLEGWESSTADTGYLSEIREDEEYIYADIVTYSSAGEGTIKISKKYRDIIVEFSTIYSPSGTFEYHEVFSKY